MAELEPVSAARLGSLLKEHQIHTVVLNACDSARADAQSEANLAASLINAGLENVIGMSYELNISAAQIFVREFYESFLVERLSIADATVRGRRALQINKSRRARFRLEVDIEDWIVPVLYRAVEGRALDLKLAVQLATDAAYGSKVSLLSIRNQPRHESTLLGRDNDLLRLECCLVQNRAVELIGQPGVGSSTLLEHAAQWWKSTKLIRSVQRFDLAQPDFVEQGEEGWDAAQWWLETWMSKFTCYLLSSKPTLAIFWTKILHPSVVIFFRSISDSRSR